MHPIITMSLPSRVSDGYMVHRLRDKGTKLILQSYNHAVVGFLQGVHLEDEKGSECIAVLYLVTSRLMACVLGLLLFSNL
jgi:hypothetical protein